MKYIPHVINLLTHQDITSQAINEFKNGDRTVSAEGMIADLAALYLYRPTKEST